MRGEGDEVRLHLVGLLECESLLALPDEETRPIERQAGERAERAQELDLVVAEEWRVRPAPDDQASARHIDSQDIRARRRYGRVCAVTRDHVVVLVEQVDRPGSDEACHRREHVRGDLLWCRCRHQAADRVRGPAPARGGAR